MQDRGQGQGQGTQGGQEGLTERLHALEVAQATQAATLAGAQATQAAAHAGTWSTMVAGAACLIAGLFLGLAISNAHKH